MPTVAISYQDLTSLLGKSVGLNNLEQLFFSTECEMKSSELEDQLDIEVTANRPDLLSTEGLARELRGISGITKGLQRYDVSNSKVSVKVSRDVIALRPFFATALIRNVRLTDSAIRQLMNLGQKLDEGLGRNRRKVSLGVHDFGAITPPVTYTAKRPEEIEFVPLNEKRSMNGRQILNHTPTGTVYGHLIENLGLFPVLVDSKGMVLSLPPIINSEDTKVTTSTSDILLDVTGLDQSAVVATCNILATSLFERGGKIESVNVSYPEKEFQSPDLRPREMTVDVGFISSVLGLEVNSDQICSLLETRRLGALKISNGTIQVQIPPYRNDFLHEVDLVEEIAIAYGYNRVQPQLPKMAVVGGEYPVEKYARRLRELVVGFGLQEVLNYIMTSREVLLRNMQNPDRPVVEVLRPVSQRYTVLRDELLPGLLETLSLNGSGSIFEVGDVVRISENVENKSKRGKNLAIAICRPDASFEEVQAIFLGIVKVLGIEKHGFRPTSHPSYLQGRVARLLVDNVDVGILGELNPQVILNFGLMSPVSAAEVVLDELQRH